jgi:hypothetical protein
METFRHGTISNLPFPSPDLSPEITCTRLQISSLVLGLRPHGLGSRLHGTGLITRPSGRLSRQSGRCTRRRTHGPAGRLRQQDGARHFSRAGMGRVAGRIIQALLGLVQGGGAVPHTRALLFTMAGRRPGILFTAAGRRPDILFTAAGRRPDILFTVAGRRPDIFCTAAGRRPDILIMAAGLRFRKDYIIPRVAGRLRFIQDHILTTAAGHCLLLA